MERPKPEQYRDYDAYMDALSEWRSTDDLEEEHPWSYLFEHGVEE